MPARPPKSATQPKQVLRLTLDVAATPERVGQVAALFHDTLCQIEPDLREGDVTMVVGNYVASAELRGWQGGGERAVRLAADLVDNATDAVQNATDAVQKDERLAGAARTLARHADVLTPYHAKFWRGDKELRAVDDVFVRTMRAAGQPTIPSSSGELRLDKAEIISVDTTFDPWSGRELLDEVKQHAALFAAEDFDRMLSDL